MGMMFCNGIAGVIAESSVEIAVVDRHYDRAINSGKRVSMHVFTSESS